MRSVSFRECIIWCFLGILITLDIGRVILEMKEPFLYLFWEVKCHLQKPIMGSKFIPVTWEVTSIFEGPQCLDFFRMEFFCPSPNCDRTESLRWATETRFAECQGTAQWTLGALTADSRRPFGRRLWFYDQITKPKRRQLSCFRIIVYRYEEV